MHIVPRKACFITSLQNPRNGDVWDAAALRPPTNSHKPPLERETERESTVVGFVSSLQHFDCNALPRITTGFYFIQEYQPCVTALQKPSKKTHTFQGAMVFFYFFLGWKPCRTDFSNWDLFTKCTDADLTASPRLECITLASCQSCSRHAPKQPFTPPPYWSGLKKALFSCEW